MDPSNLPLYLGAAATAYGMANLPLTPLSAAAVGGVAGGVIKRVYDEIHASQESTQDPDYWYAVPPSKRLRGFNQDNMDVVTNQNMAYPRSSRMGVKRFKKKVTWKRRSWKKTTGSKYPRRLGGVTDVALSVPGFKHARKMASKSTGFSTLQFDTSGSFLLLNGMALGTTQNGDRIGRDIYMHDLLITGFVQNRSTAIINQCRLLVFLDTMPDGGTPTLADIMESSTSLSLVNKATARRYNILYDECIPLVGQPATTGTSGCKSVSISVPIKQSAYFNLGNAGTIADFEKNALFCMTVGHNAAGTAAAEAYLAFQVTYIAQ